MRPDSAPEVFFLPVNGSERFCLLHLPPVSPRGSILYLHPFAEEMNRSRAVAARQARAFAAAGYAVLQIDLHGCGDSADDFGAASWDSWRADVHAALRLLQQRFAVPLCLWGLRSGALLASEVAREWAGEISLLLWQPVLSGQQHLQQFLRLSLAADMLEGRAGARGSSETLFAQLESGRAIEIAGYTLAPDLARGLAASRLAQPEPAQRMHCIELVPAGGDLSPALRRFAEGGNASVRACEDAQCWSASGVLTCPALEAVSLNAMRTLLP